ncbi:MAG: hypothetical protein KAT27_08380, partial [Desulfobacterales bacterium]|nr:hypothetical protein [Desulfobacterales bacterium]
MENRTNGQFREDEIALMTHWDKKEEKWVKSIHPKVGGRLRLAHEDNDRLSITTEIVKHDGNIAVVKALTTTNKGSFPGLGMSSVERDQTIAPAILELAETRAIARSLRFAGYGVEYCSAEEISHLENSNGKGSRPNNNAPSQSEGKEAPRGKGGNGQKPPSGEGNGGLSARQHSYILDLTQEKGITRSELNNQCLEAYGVGLDHLSRPDASSLINQLLMSR